MGVAHVYQSFSSTAMPMFICGRNDHYFPFHAFSNVGRSTRGIHTTDTSGANYRPLMYGISGPYSADGANCGHLTKCTTISGMGPYGMNILWLGGKPVPDGKYNTNKAMGSFTGTSGTTVTGVSPNTNLPTGMIEIATGTGSSCYDWLDTREFPETGNNTNNGIRCSMTTNRTLLALTTTYSGTGAAGTAYGWVRVLQGRVWFRLPYTTIPTRGIYIIRQDGVELTSQAQVVTGTNGHFTLESKDCQGMWCFFCMRWNNSTNTTISLCLDGLSGGNNIFDLYSLDMQTDYWPAPAYNENPAYGPTSFVLPRGLASNKSCGVSFWMAFPQDWAVPSNSHGDYFHFFQLGGNGDSYIDGLTYYIGPTGNLSAKWNKASAVPPLTSNTGPNGTAFAGATRTGWAPYMAFDGKVNYNLYEGWTLDSSNTANWTVGYQFTTAKTINRYGIYRTARPDKRDPYSWNLQGSNNGTNWTTIDTRTAITYSDNSWGWWDVTSPGSYTYYRLQITALKPGNDGWPYLAELKLLEGATDQSTGYSVSSWRAWEWHHVVVNLEQSASTTATAKLFIDNVLRHTATFQSPGLLSFVHHFGGFTMDHEMQFACHTGEQLMSGLVIRPGGIFSDTEISDLYSGMVYDPLDYMAITTGEDFGPVSNTSR